MKELSEGVVFIDGARCAQGEAKVSIYDRGFLYGDSVFEVIRTYGGEPFGLREHVARLHRSAAKIELPLPWSEDSLEREIRGAVAAGAYPESYVRVIVTRGVGALGLDPDFAGAPTRVVMVHPLALPPASVYRDGVAVLVVESMRATDGTAAEGAKSSNYLANLLALRDAKRAGAYEPLFVDRGIRGTTRETNPETLDDAEVLEGGTSNVFAIELGSDGAEVLVTPPDRRILGGITRKHVLDAATASGMQIRIEPITLRRFRTAKELFLTSTVREIVPIVRVLTGSKDDPKDSPKTHATAATIGDGTPGTRTRALHEAFRRHVHAETSPMPWERQS